MSDTTGKYRFQAKDDAEGHPFIDIERKGGQDILGGHMHLNCPPGTAYADAEYLARLLNRSVVSVTRLDPAHGSADPHTAPSGRSPG
jgi:hypothetical protein